MKKDMENIIITTNKTSVIKERAASLAKSINEAKERGLEIAPNEPIEGKIFWDEM